MENVILKIKHDGKGKYIVKHGRKVFCTVFDKATFYAAHNIKMPFPESEAFCVEYTEIAFYAKDLASAQEKVLSIAHQWFNGFGQVIGCEACKIELVNI